MTTIITKNGSGAPTAGQLSQGELAVDLTNKELYTKDSGGNVIKVGAQGGSTGTFTDLTATSSFTSPGIDDNANATAITIDASENVGIGTNAPAALLHCAETASGLTARFSNEANQTLDVGTVAGSGSAGSVYLDNPNSGNMQFRIGGSEAMRIGSAGNVSTTERLRIGTGSGDTRITLNNEGTEQTNSSNFIRGVSGSLIYNSASSVHKWEIAGSEKMRIDAAGNVGIGTSAPSFPLEVDGGSGDGIKIKAGNSSNDDSFLIANSSDAALLKVDGAGNVGYSGKLFSSNDATTLGGLQLYRNHSSGDCYLFDTSAAPYSGDMIFGTSNAEAMRIDASGNLLVGTADGSFINGGGIKIANAQAARLKLCDTDTAGTGSADGMELTQSGTAAYVFNNENDFMAFGTNATERMRVDASGNFLVGRTAVAAVNIASASLNADGSVYSSVATANSYHLYNTTAGAYKFYVSSGGIIHAGSNVITVLSDERLKENIRDLDDGLDKIMALQPRKFDWKEGKGQDCLDDRGFIAQELETVFPDMVKNDGLNLDEEGDSYKTIAPNLVPTLVKAIQEQQAMIETLQAEVAALKGA